MNFGYGDGKGGYTTKPPAASKGRSGLNVAATPKPTSRPSSGGSGKKPYGPIGNDKARRTAQKNYVTGQKAKGEQDALDAEAAWAAAMAALLGTEDGGSGGGGSGSGGGGGGGYDMSAAVRAQYNQTRGDAQKRQTEGSAKVGEMYNSLSDSFKGLAADTGTRYSQAITANTDGTQALVDQARARINSEAASRAAGLSELGIQGQPAAPGTPSVAQGTLSEAAGEAEHNIGSLQSMSQNWNGLMGSQKQSQITRDNLNVSGAKETGVRTQTDMLASYEEYLRGLQAEEQQALAGAVSAGSGGGGGGGGRRSGGSGGSTKKSKLQQAFDQANMEKLLAEKGVYVNSNARQAYGPQDPAKLGKLEQSFSDYGVRGGKSFNNAADVFRAGGIVAPAYEAQLRSLGFKPPTK